MATRKLFIAALVAVSTFLPMSAQDSVYDNPDNAPYIGIRAALDITSLQSAGDFYTNRAGFAIGAVYNKPLWKNLFFEPGLYLYYNSVGIKAIEYPDYDFPGGRIDNWGIGVPLDFGFHFHVTDDVTISPYTGPRVNVNLSSSTKYKKSTPDEASPSYNTLGMGWDFGVGVSYRKCYVAVGGTVGITHYIKEQPAYYYARRNVVSVTLGYNL